MIRDLASLLSPATEEFFLRAILEKNRFHVKSDDPKRAAPLLPWFAINQIIESDTLAADRLRVVRSNVDVLPVMFRSRDAASQLRAGTLRSLLAQGASVVINRIDDLVPSVGRLADAIERRLSHTTWVNAYLSFGRGSAFKAHWDSHDVLVLQVHGSKRWRSFGSPMPLPVEGHGPTDPFPREAVWEDQLGAGDVLYLPRGEIHEATLEGSESVHLTIGIAAAHGVDWLRSLADDFMGDVVARADLTRLVGDTALLEQERRLKQHLHSLVDEASLASFLNSADEKRKPRPLLNMGLVEKLSATTVLVPALRRRVPLLPEGEAALDVVIGGESVNLSALERRVLSLLLERNSLRFGDLIAVLGATGDPRGVHDAVQTLAKKALVGLVLDTSS